MSEQLSFTQLLRKNEFIESNTNEETTKIDDDFDPDEKIENLERKIFEEETRKAEQEAEEAKKA
ncbi:MAG: hypothetical protein BZ133_00135, partial [Methanosphaera sp. SHI613]